jgi:AcrR family transcriptional regulator
MGTADRLIESTRELLWERGYVGTSPKVILARSGTGQSSMYHHFKGGKADLAAAAIDRTAQEMRTEIDKQFSAPGTALERITAYLLREREVLKGCAVGGLTQDPDVIADPNLSEPIKQTFAWLRDRVAKVVAEGRDASELRAELDPDRVASAIVAVLQGGYVLARAAGDPAEFYRATEGVVALLEQHQA